MNTVLATPFDSRTRYPDPTVGWRRRAAALAQPAAFAAQAVCNALYAWASRDGGGDTGEGASTLRFHAEHAGTMTTATVFALTGCLLAVAGLPAALRVLRPARPRLSLVAVVLMMAGYVCYFGIVFTGFDTIALGRHGVDAGAALDASPVMTAGLPFLLTFVAGNLLGAVLLGVSVILSRRHSAVGVPWWAGLLILGWPVGHVINLVVVDETYAVIGGLLQVAGLIMISRAAFGLSDADWVDRG